MMPWYRGFAGEILEVPAARNASGKSFLISGTIQQLEGGELRITELPIRKWTQDYKEYLDSMVKPEDKNATPLLLDYKEHHTDTTVDFTVTLTEAGLKAVQEKGLVTFFKVQSKISTSNMMLFDASGKIVKYESPEHILKDFFELRLDYYEKRRISLLARAQEQLQRISNKVQRQLNPRAPKPRCCRAAIRTIREMANTGFRHQRGLNVAHKGRDRWLSTALGFCVAEA